MKRYKFVVDIPTIAASEKAYNPNRPISSLLMHQLRHLHAAEYHVLPEKDRSGVNITTLHTELQASNYIRQVTEKLQSRAKKSSNLKSAKKKQSAKVAKKGPAKPKVASGRGKPR
jgi:aminoglycoside phosphotransferase